MSFAVTANPISFLRTWQEISARLLRCARNDRPPHPHPLPPGERESCWGAHGEPKGDHTASSRCGDCTRMVRAPVRADGRPARGPLVGRTPATRHLLDPERRPGPPSEQLATDRRAKLDRLMDVPLRDPLDEALGPEVAAQPGFQDDVASYHVDVE